MVESVTECVVGCNIEEGTDKLSTPCLCPSRFCRNFAKKKLAMQGIRYHVIVTASQGSTCRFFSSLCFAHSSLLSPSPSLDSRYYIYCDECSSISLSTCRRCGFDINGPLRVIPSLPFALQMLLHASDILLNFISIAT